MPWYIGDYLRDTMHLDAEQDGAYRRLIDACWLRNGLLKDDDFQFAAITKLSPARWKKVRPVIEEFFVVEADGWRHKRVSHELQVALDNVESRRRGGKLTADKRWGKDSSATSSATVELIAPGLLHGRPSPSPSPSQDIIVLPNGNTPASTAKSARREVESEFDEIWPLFPRKRDKGHALKAFVVARKTAALADIHEGLVRFSQEAATADPNYLPYPATWLTGKRWLDEPTHTNGHDVSEYDGPREPAPQVPEGWEERINAQFPFARRG